MDGSQEVTSSLVIAGCNGSELFEFAKEILDQMPCLVQVFVIEPPILARTFWRDDGCLPCPG